MPQQVCGRPGGFGVQRVPPHGRCVAHGARIAHRGHRAPARGGEHPHAGGPHGGCGGLRIHCRYARALSQLLGRRVGPSTGTNFVAMLTLASEMRERGERGSILSLLCDVGERYLPTYFDTAWVERTFGDCSAAQQGGWPDRLMPATHCTMPSQALPPGSLPLAPGPMVTRRQWLAQQMPWGLAAVGAAGWLPCVPRMPCRHARWSLSARPRQPPGAQWWYITPGYVPPPGQPWGFQITFFRSRVDGTQQLQSAFLQTPAVCARRHHRCARPAAAA